MTVYALNDVEFCVGNNLVGYLRAHILLDCGFSVSDTILLTTSMPTRPEKPLEIVQISDQEEEEASGGLLGIAGMGRDDGSTACTRTGPKLATLMRTEPTRAGP